MLPEPVKKKKKILCIKKTSRTTANIKLLLKTLMKKLTSSNNLICGDQVHELWLLTASVVFNITTKRPCNRIHSQQFLLDILLQKKAADGAGQHDSFGSSEQQQQAVFVLNKIQNNVFISNSAFLKGANTYKWLIFRYLIGPSTRLPVIKVNL